ncbi:hypothetical protein MARPO_0016s0140 [Marchantia polymorpha]|uniref:Uncharacterized protein n=1 Tax=Marchantia polymorpha TaxID=3197 RepID=A0A2R6XG75_MARPO|nr:hypothetical protein MARPO_0016s0140 [Marchantia polymorpha]|eukprot:PTQ45091.1 hypothetical protein MARPO_0016s0140 [Marchantia polymorpha]
MERCRHRPIFENTDTTAWRLGSPAASEKGPTRFAPCIAHRYELAHAPCSKKPSRDPRPPYLGRGTDELGRRKSARRRVPGESARKRGGSEDEDRVARGSRGSSRRADPLRELLAAAVGVECGESRGDEYTRRGERRLSSEGRGAGRGGVGGGAGRGGAGARGRGPGAGHESGCGQRGRGADRSQVSPIAVRRSSASVSPFYRSRLLPAALKLNRN